MWHLVPYSRSDASTNESSILHVNAVDHLMCLGYQQVVLLFLEIVGWCVKDEIALSELYLLTGHTHLFRVIVYIQMQRLTCLYLHLHVEDIYVVLEYLRIGSMHFNTILMNQMDPAGGKAHWKSMAMTILDVWIVWERLERGLSKRQRIKLKESIPQK